MNKFSVTSSNNGYNKFYFKDMMPSTDLDEDTYSGKALAVGVIQPELLAVFSLISIC